MTSTEIIQLESEFPWQLANGELDSISGPNIEEGPDINKSPQWFRYNAQMGGETEQEQKEKQQCIEQQLNLGILRKKNAKENVTHVIKDDKLKNELYGFTELLKTKPTDIKPEDMNSFRPKVIDKNTGQKRKLGPNDKCPCGSGKKFKKCHGIGKF